MWLPAGPITISSLSLSLFLTQLTFDSSHGTGHGRSRYPDCSPGLGGLDGEHTHRHG
jgi:hypothetical protein